MVELPNFKNLPNIIIFGERDDRNGGPFCGIAIVDIKHEKLKTEINNNYSDFKKVHEAKLGLEEIAIFRGVFPGMAKDVAISIQSGYGSSVLSAYFID